MATFTEEIQNSIRLSCLLVNDGTKCLRQVFIDKLEKKYNQNDLGTILAHPNVMQIIDDHKKGKNKKPRIITRDQYSVLYPPTKVNVEDFDLTLICCLCDILCNIKIEEKGKDDKSLGADISRIRKIRNGLFAHMTKFGMATSEFESQWKELMDILVRLGGDEKQMKKWKTEALSPQLYEDQKRAIISLIKNDTESIQVLNDNILECQDYEKKIYENVDKVGLEVARIPNAIFRLESNMKKWFLQSETDNVESESLSDIKCILQKSKESYKILLINKPTNVEAEDIVKCSAALGCVPWDIIFDLDNRTKLDNGIYSKLTFSLKRLRKDFISCTYAETSEITEDVKEKIAKGQCSLYVLANGCEKMEIPPINENILVTGAKPISRLLEDVFKQIPTKKNILLTVLILGENNAHYINRLIQSVKEEAESIEEKFELTNSNVLTLYMQEDLDKTVANMNFWNCKHCRAPIAQLIHMFEYLFCNDTAEDKNYIFPGKQGPWCFHSREMEKLKETVELYHDKIGEIAIEGLNVEELEDKIQSIKEDFLKGGEITPEALFINNKHQIFVERDDEMTGLKERIEKMLESRKQWSNHDPSYLRLQHDASGGATTSIRFVMYSLRNKYPCLIVHKICDNLFEILTKIKRKSELPLLIVLDDNELSENDAKYVHSCLKDKFNIKGLVVHVQRGKNCSEAGNELQIFIPSTVTKIETAAFNKLYETSKKKKGSHKVFLFGLIAFCDEYKRLDMHIDTCIAECTPQQKHILQIVILIWKYCHMATKVKLVNMVEPQLGTSGNIFSNLGYAMELLVCSNDNNEEIRPAHSCIIEPVLQKLIGESKEDQLGEFLLNILDLLTADFQGKIESSRILTKLFLQKSKNQGQSIVHWSQLVLDLQKYCGNEYVCDVLTALYIHCEDVHSPFHKQLKLLVSVYEMFEMRDTVSSVVTFATLYEDPCDFALEYLLEKKGPFALTNPYFLQNFRCLIYRMLLHFMR